MFLHFLFFSDIFQFPVFQISKLIDFYYFVQIPYHIFLSVGTLQ